MQFESRYNIWNATACATTAAMPAQVMDMRWSSRDDRYLWLKAFSSAGTADVKIEYYESADGTNWGPVNTVTASTNTLWSGNNPEDFHQYVIDTGMPWIKLQVTGVGSNNADCVLTASLMFMESLPADQSYAMISRMFDDAI